jgi:hypothetical protein
MPAAMDSLDRELLAAKIALALAQKDCPGCRWESTLADALRHWMDTGEPN